MPEGSDPANQAPDGRHAYAQPRDLDRDASASLVQAAQERGREDVDAHASNVMAQDAQASGIVGPPTIGCMISLGNQAEVVHLSGMTHPASHSTYGLDDHLTELNVRDFDNSFVGVGCGGASELRILPAQE